MRNQTVLTDAEAVDLIENMANECRNSAGKEHSSARERAAVKKVLRMVLGRTPTIDEVKTVTQEV